MRCTRTSDIPLVGRACKSVDIAFVLMPRLRESTVAFHPQANIVFTFRWTYTKRFAFYFSCFHLFVITALFCDFFLFLFLSSFVAPVYHLPWPTLRQMPMSISEFGGPMLSNLRIYWKWNCAMEKTLRDKYEIVVATDRQLGTYKASHAPSATSSHNYIRPMETYEFTIWARKLEKLKILLEMRLLSCDFP